MLAGNVYRPELRFHSPLAQPRDIRVPGIQPLRKIKLGQTKVALAAQPPGQVVVPVEEHAGRMNLPGSL